MQAMVQTLQQLPAGHPVARAGDLFQQLRDTQRGLRNIRVLSMIAARGHTGRRGRPTKDAVREFVWQLMVIFERFTGRNPGQRVGLKFVKLAARPVDPELGSVALDHVVREIVGGRKKSAAD